MSLTLVIIAITCVVSFLAFNNAQLMRRLILWPPAVTRGKEYWRLITSGLIHADGSHLLFNMITLYFFGPMAERTITANLGPVGYIGFYVAALVASGLPSYLDHKNDENYFALGASGAVVAVLFAFILQQPWSLIFVWFIPVPAIIYAVLYIAYSVYMARKGNTRIGHSAHLWGAAFGVAFVSVMDPHILGQFLDRVTHPSATF
jgi:membrane associated rhomboid family serine protease